VPAKTKKIVIKSNISGSIRQKITLQSEERRKPKKERKKIQHFENKCIKKMSRLRVGTMLIPDFSEEQVFFSRLAIPEYQNIRCYSDTMFVNFIQMIRKVNFSAPLILAVGVTAPRDKSAPYNRFLLI
jgi:hypothetical protein